MAERQDALHFGDIDFDLERLVLGVPLIRPELLDTLVSRVRPDFFGKEGHRQIFHALMSLYESGLDITLDTLVERLQRDGTLEEVGGFEYLHRLLEHPPSVDYHHYLKRLHEHYLRRKLGRLLEQYQEICLDPATPPQEVLARLESELATLHTETERKGLRRIKDSLGELWKYLERIYQEGGELTGLPTGFVYLDMLTSGLQNGDFIVIAGRPAMGKTSFAINLALNLARMHYKVAFFSLEMAAQQLLQRMLASLCRIDLQKIRSARFTIDEWNTIAEAMSKLSNYDFFLDDTAGITVQDLRAQCRTMKRDYGLDVVFIDYLQLLRAHGRYENRQQEVTAISRNLKELAKELNAPVIALSQLSRLPERRENNRPQLADLRESGSLEQDADVVIFLYREEYYNKETPRKNLAEVIIAKQRNGPTETVRLVFQKNFQRFENIQDNAADFGVPG